MECIAGLGRAVGQEVEEVRIQEVELLGQALQLLRRDEDPRGIQARQPPPARYAPAQDIQMT